MKKFCCRECGMDCSFQTSGTESQITQNVIHHMHTDHEMDVIPAEVMLKMYLAIRNKHSSGMAPHGRMAELLTV